MINPWRPYPHEHARVCFCSSPNWVPSQTMSLLTISQHIQVSLVFRNWGCQEEVAGRCGVRTFKASNWELLTNVVIQMQSRNCNYISNSLYLINWASADPQKTLLKRLNTTHSMTTICACKRPHTSQRIIQYKICGCRRTTVTQTPRWTLVAGQEKSSGHSFIALSCPTKYLQGEVQLLLPPPSDLQVTYHFVWLIGYHHKVSRRKHTSWICLRNTV